MPVTGGPSNLHSHGPLGCLVRSACQGSAMRTASQAVPARLQIRTALATPRPTNFVQLAARRVVDITADDVPHPLTVQLALRSTRDGPRSFMACIAAVIVQAVFALVPIS